MATLQQQGVPWGSRLGPKRQSQPAIRNQYIRTRTPTPEGGSRTVTTHYAAPTGASRGRNAAPPLRKYNPANAGDSVTGSTGMLEGEFLLCLGLLVLLMFANTTSSYGEKIMSVMKRGTLICLLFFLLAIISNIGPNAEKVAKAFGAMIIVAILITTPINTVVTDVDNIIKNDWVGSSETGGDTAASADAGTGGGTSSAAQNAVNNATATLGNSAVSAMEAWLLHLSGPAATTVNNAVKSVLAKLHL
jgi:hypothetical protein